MINKEVSSHTIISAEGCRRVRWGTGRSEIPWAWSNAGFGAPCALREDEDFNVYDVLAEALSYTFRNNVFYGVRIDFADPGQNGVALSAFAGQYPPNGEIVRHVDGSKFWQTAETSVWVEPATATASGQICLWGRYPMFADDADRPVYLARSPSANAFPVAYQPHSYVCYRASGPIAIDGRLDEKAWRDAHWSQVFEDHQASYAPPPWKTTRFKVLYDDEYLYFGAELQEENVWGTLHERNSVIYADNDFEIFLNPTPDGVGYYEFEINALNTVWGMFHETDYHRASALDSNYNVSGIRHAAHVEGTLNYHHDHDVGWTVEVRWPLAALRARNDRVQLPIERGVVWRVNFSRVQYLHI